MMHGCNPSNNTVAAAREVIGHNLLASLTMTTKILRLASGLGHRGEREEEERKKHGSMEQEKIKKEPCKSSKPHLVDEKS